MNKVSLKLILALGLLATVTVFGAEPTNIAAPEIPINANLRLYGHLYEWSDDAERYYLSISESPCAQSFVESLERFYTRQQVKDLMGTNQNPKLKLDIDVDADEGFIDMTVHSAKKTPFAFSMKSIVRLVMKPKLVDREHFHFSGGPLNFSGMVGDLALKDGGAPKNCSLNEKRAFQLIQKATETFDQQN